MQPDDPTLERSFRGHKDAVTSVCFNNNMKQLISGSLDGCVMIWNFKPQLRAYRFAGHKAAVYSVAFSPAHSLIASASKDRTIRLWQPSVEGKSTVLKAHTGTVRCVDFSNDGRMLLSASDDKTIKVWALPTQRFAFTLSGHQNWVRSCAASPDCRLAVSGGDDRCVKVWDLGSKKCIRSYDDHTGCVNTVAFHPDGTCVASAGTDNTIKLWDIRTNQLLQHYKAHTGAVTHLTFHPSGNFLLTTSLDATLKAGAGAQCAGVQVWDLREGALFYTLHGHEGATLGGAFSPAGDYFASAGADEQVMVWKTNFDRCLEDCVMPGISRAGQSPLGGSSQALMPPGSRAPAAASSRSSFNHSPLPQQQQQLAEGQVRPASANTAGGLPDSLAATLQHIVGQLDVLTQTMAMLDERLTMNEDRVRRMDDKMDAVMGGPHPAPALSNTLAAKADLGSPHYPGSSASPGQDITLSVDQTHP
ncbi:centriole proteome protein [Haematococcus lacustris]